MRRPPAIPLVHPQNIEPSPIRLLRRPQHVPRFARSLKPMQQNQSRPAPRLRLPMTLSKNPRPRLNLKLPRHPSPQRSKLPRPKSSRQCHQMSIPQKRRRDEFTHEQKFTIGRETAQQAKQRVPHAPVLRVGFLTLFLSFSLSLPSPSVGAPLAAPAFARPRSGERSLNSCRKNS